ncbi:hypothetical protein Tco_0773944 [Tanacetum coccineum]|uniref:Uncharacterized protein n=1 Tax=Tanacetum coccineum TaxID=301880 RepID=A0ABQ4ZR52_9ASTR
MVEEPLKMKKKDQINFDEQEAIRLQAKFNEDKRLAKEKDEASVALTEEWNDIQGKINIDYQLAQRLQAQEQEELTDEEKARLDSTRSSSKRAGEALEQESSKKQKVEEDKEYEELKQCLEIIPDDGDDVTINATPLSTKSPSIVDYKIYKEGKKSYSQIIRADVKDRFKKTEPVNYMDNFLLLNLKTVFVHHVEDSVWKNQEGLVKVLNWKLYDSCRVHCVTMQSILYYLLLEKMYPLTNHTLHQMFNDVKLQVDYECEMAFELLRLLSMKKLEILQKNIKFRGGLLGLKAFLKLLLLRRLKEEGVNITVNSVHPCIIATNIARTSALQRVAVCEYNSGCCNKGSTSNCSEDEKSGSEDNHNEDDHVTEVENVNENENKTDGNDYSVIEENRKGDDLSARKKFRSKFNTKWVNTDRVQRAKWNYQQ